MPEHTSDARPDGGQSRILLATDARGRHFLGETPFVTRSLDRGLFLGDIEVPAAIDLDDAVPADFEILAAGRDVVCAESDIGVVLVHRRFRSTTIELSAPSRDLLAKLTAIVRDHVSRFEVAFDEASIDVTVWWYSSGAGPARLRRRIEVPAWHEIARNYPASLRARLGDVVLGGVPTGTGRLLLWFGEPGTGKTTAALALMREWRSWCDAHVITDPDRLFTEPDFLQQVLLGDVHEDPTAQPRWKIIVAEDADEFLRADARRRSGPALGRLLNASDGILGRGTRTLLLLTTNDDLGRLHAAIVRPGRAAHVVEFTRFSRDEAREWLGAGSGRLTEGATLAELYAVREGVGVPHDASTALPRGQYL
jgi:hypothetical protein